MPPKKKTTAPARKSLGAKKKKVFIEERTPTKSSGEDPDTKSQEESEESEETSKGDDARKVKKGAQKLATSAEESSETDLEERDYLLKREKLALMSKVKRAQREIMKLRAKETELEFNHLQNPQKVEERSTEWRENVEMWSKYVGATLEHVSCARGELGRDWLLHGTIEGMAFKLNILCTTDDVKKKGYVQKFAITCSESCNNELQQWLSTNEGNIEQILKVLKSYARMNKARDSGLERCKLEFSDIVTIQDQGGEKVIELGTEDAYFFQIKWKLVPSTKHFAKVKNVCRIACTQDGDKYIKKHADLAVIKKRLNQSPIEVIEMLAKGMSNREENEGDGNADTSEKDSSES